MEPAQYEEVSERNTSLQDFNGQSEEERRTEEFLLKEVLERSLIESKTLVRDFNKPQTEEERQTEELLLKETLTRSLFTPENSDN